MWRAIWSLGLAYAAFFGIEAAAGQDRGSRDIILLKSDGSQVRVPASGPLASPAAQEIARDVQAYDRRARSQPFSGAADPQIAQAVERLAQEVRDDAVDRLDQTYRLADVVAGPLDQDLLEAARKTADALKQMMRAPPPPRLNVRTQITVTLPNASLHYCLRGDYKANACSWRSYSTGDVLPIGLYMFRAESAGNEPTEEEVLVLNDPTTRMIAPMRRSL